MMVQPIVQCDQLTKRYGKKSALDHLDLVIPAGRIVGILGPNGCGKSTLFRAITGLVTPDEGEIRVLEQSPGWQTNRHIGYLPDRARWYPRHTVLQAFEWGASFLLGFDLDAAKTFPLYASRHGRSDAEKRMGERDIRMVAHLALLTNVSGKCQVLRCLAADGGSILLRVCADFAVYGNHRPAGKRIFV